MPSRGRVKQAEIETRRQLEDGVRSLIHAQSEGRPGEIPADCDSAPPSAASNALASRRCAARVADALKRIGYGFAVIPSTAKPRRK
jgi:hypothetical protein